MLTSWLTNLENGVNMSIKLLNINECSISKALAALAARLAAKAPSLAATPAQIDAILVLRRCGHAVHEIAARLNLPRATVGLVIRESGIRTPRPPRPSGLGPPWWGLR